MSVYQKIIKLQQATRSLQADASGQTGAARYKYLSGTKLLGQVRPKMDELGLLLLPEVTDISNTPITYRTTNNEKLEMFTSIKLRFTWIDADDGSSLSQEFAANGMNAFDKGLGSALTYAERYFLLKTLHIATDEDDVDALVKDEAITGHVGQAPAPDTAQAPAPAAAPMEQYRGGMPSHKYWQTVHCYVDGKRSKDGQDMRSAWISIAHPTEDDVRQFDQDAAEVRKARTINK